MGKKIIGPKINLGGPRVWRTELEILVLGREKRKVLCLGASSGAVLRYVLTLNYLANAEYVILHCR